MMCWLSDMNKVNLHTHTHTCILATMRTVAAVLVVLLLIRAYATRTQTLEDPIPTDFVLKVDNTPTYFDAEPETPRPPPPLPCAQVEMPASG